jgi:threonine dehydrogenase-like Zn-dependent dehydrogenase
VAWYGGGAAELRLGEEWHFNRQVMVSGARLESLPYRDHPRWDDKRVEHTALELFEKKRLTVEGMLRPMMPLAQAAEAYRIILDEPEKAVKCAITFP